MSNSVLDLNEKIRRESAWVEPLKTAIAKIIIGQQYLVDRLILGLICNGHVLLEGVPGLAQDQLSVRTLASTISADFQRIQFTPDPASRRHHRNPLVYNPKDHSFETKKGSGIHQSGVGR